MCETSPRREFGDSVDVAFSEFMNLGIGEFMKLVSWELWCLGILWFGDFGLLCLWNFRMLRNSENL